MTPSRFDVLPQMDAPRRGAFVPKDKRGFFQNVLDPRAEPKSFLGGAVRQLLTRRYVVPAQNLRVPPDRSPMLPASSFVMRPN